MSSTTKGAFASVRAQGGQGVRPLLTGSDIPLVLAAIEPLESIYRSVNTYSNFAEPAIEGSPEGQTHTQLGERARTILDGIYRDGLAAWRSLVEARISEGGRLQIPARRLGRRRWVRWTRFEVVPGRIGEGNARTSLVPCMPTSKAHVPALISSVARSMKPSNTRRTWPSSAGTPAPSRSLTTLRMTSSSPASSKSAMTTVPA